MIALTQLPVVQSILLLVGMLSTPGKFEARRVRATNFDRPEVDRFNRGPLACTLKPLTDDDVVIASRTLPCGARVLLYAPRTGRSVLATVQERGPYGRNFRGIDLAPAVTRALRANGWESVVLVRLPPLPARRR